MTTNRPETDLLSEAHLLLKSLLEDNNVEGKIDSIKILCGKIEKLKPKYMSTHLFKYKNDPVYREEYKRKQNEKYHQRKNASIGSVS